MKTKFICVTPISSRAKLNFQIDMSQLHSCRVKDENDQSYYLESLNKTFYFWVNKQQDPNWRIEK